MSAADLHRLMRRENDIFKCVQRNLKREKIHFILCRFLIPGVDGGTCKLLVT